MLDIVSTLTERYIRRVYYTCPRHVSQGIPERSLPECSLAVNTLANKRHVTVLKSFSSFNSFQPKLVLYPDLSPNADFLVRVLHIYNGQSQSTSRLKEIQTVSMIYHWLVERIRLTLY
jgi:hypothetical protein